MNENTVTVSRLDFLIHPMFEAMARRRESDEAKKRFKPSKFDRMFDVYLERARTLKGDEVMAAFSSLKPSAFRENPRAIRLFRELRAILGRRLIVLSAYQRIFTEDSPALAPYKGARTLKRIAEARGLIYDRKTPTVAYGELFGGCVDAAANFLNRTGGFTKKTRLLPELTDMAVEPKARFMRKVVFYGSREYRGILYPRHLRS